MKKLLAVALCILMLFCPNVDCQAVQADAKLSLDRTDFYVGDTITLTVSLNAQQNMNAYFYRLRYDSSKVSFVSTSAENYNALTDEIVYIYIGNTSCVSETFVFELIGEGDATFTAYEITYADNEEYYLGEQSLSFAVHNVVAGDVDGNGVIQTADLATLKLYLAGIGDIFVAFAGADMNANGQIDTTDLANLKLHLAGVK